MDLEKIASAHDADILIIYTMIDALLASHPSPSAVLAAFKSKATSLVENAPPDIPKEQIVELRARIAQNLLSWERTTGASAKR